MQFFSALRCFLRGLILHSFTRTSQTKTTRTEGVGVAAVLAEGDRVAHIASQATPCRRPHDVRPPARRREPPQRRQPSLRRPHTTSAPSQWRYPPKSTSSITDPHLQVICKLLVYLLHTFFFPSEPCTFLFFQSENVCSIFDLGNDAVVLLNCICLMMLTMTEQIWGGASCMSRNFCCNAL